MRRFLLISIAGVFLSSLAAAQSLYLIELRDHTTQYFSGDRPIDNGRVVVFHRHPDGTLLSIHKDEIARVARVPAGVTNRALLPGEAIDVGITGGERRETSGAQENEATAPAGAPGSYGGGGYGGGAPRPGMNSSMGVASSPVPAGAPSPATGSPGPMTGYPSPTMGHPGAARGR